MPGYRVTFEIDLLKIPCFFGYACADGDSPVTEVNTKHGDLNVEICLSAKGGSTVGSSGSGRRGFFLTATVTIIDPVEELELFPNLEGRVASLLPEMQGVVLTCLQRLVAYFKYEKRQPHLKQISIINMLNQESKFWNPEWSTLDGKKIDICASPLKAGIFSSYLPLPDGLFGNSLVSTDDVEHIQRALQDGDQAVGLTAEILSDAQDAGMVGNVRRAVLELAITIEVFVKSSFYRGDKMSASAFDYLEDKGRETVKVLELLDGASSYAFGESFKKVSPAAYLHLDHLFRCRNKIAHRGEARFRDDGGDWHEVTPELLANWWSSAIEMFGWLDLKRSGG